MCRRAEGGAKDPIVDHLESILSFGLVAGFEADSFRGQGRDARPALWCDFALWHTGRGRLDGTRWIERIRGMKIAHALWWEEER